MTLILSQITPDYVIQVSDRRLTLDGLPFDDDSSKAVLYNQHFAFAYTGLAEISAGVRTDEWLSKILFEQSEGYFDDALTAVCRAATTAMASNQFSDKRLAIVGVGWVHKDEESVLLPLYVSISNFQNRKGEWTAEVADQFSIFCTSLDPGIPHKILVAGQPIDPDIKHQLDRISRECVKRQIGPSELGRLLMAGLLTVASSNKMVGSSIMIAAIPRAAVQKLATPGLRITLFGAPMEDTPTFLHLPTDASEPVRYGPRVVNPGVLFSRFEVRPLPPDYKPEPPTLL